MGILLSKRLNKYYLIGEKRKANSVIKRLQDFGVFHINYVNVGLQLSAFKADALSDLRAKNEIEEFLAFSKKFGYAKKGSRPLKKGVLPLIRTLIPEAQKLERQLNSLESEEFKLKVLRHN